MKAVVIGCGSIAPVHIDAILASGNEVIGLCDKNPVRAQTLKDRFGLTCGIYTDFRRLKELCPDAVHICTPHYLHAEMIKWALSENFNVLSEKPLCINAQELEEIGKALSLSRGKLGICLQNRYNESTLFAEKLLADKKIAGAFGSVIWRRDSDYYLGSDWRGRKISEGGSALINQAIHTMDLMFLLCGYPKTVAATVANHRHKGTTDTEDTVSALFEGGCAMHFFASTTADRDFPVRIEILTEDSRIAVEQDSVTVDGIKTSTAQRRETFGKQVWGCGHKRLISDFYSCLNSGARFPVGYEEAARIMRAVFAVYASNGVKTGI